VSDSPDVIYLQWIPEKTWYDDQVTWCEDRINDDDVEYIKKSTATLRLELLGECREIMMLLPAAIFDQIPNDLWARLAKELDDD
jgi:hypothetical protein